MNLLVIRHGQSEADILNVIEGRADFELTELGKKQAGLMADWVKSHFQVDKIFSSPLKRAEQTANLLSVKTNIEVLYDDELMEFQNGLIAGLSREEANEKYPEPFIKYPHTELYNMESMIQFRMRAETALSKIINENNPDYTIAIVGHGGIINMLFRSFLELPVNTRISLATGDTGIHNWHLKDNMRRIVFSNSQIHLNSLQ